MSDEHVVGVWALLSESAPPLTFTVGEEDVEDILVVDHGARFAVKTSIEGSDLYAQTAYNGPFVRVMWVGH